MANEDNTLSNVDEEEEKEVVAKTFGDIFGDAGTPPTPINEQLEPEDYVDDEGRKQYRLDKEEIYKKLIPKLEEHSIRPFLTIRRGLAVSTILTGVGIVIGYMSSSFFAGASFSALSWLYFYVGLIDIPIGWKGVPLILGNRNEPWSALLSEGSHWLPKPFVSAELIDMRERTNNVEGLDIIATGTIPLLGEDQESKVEVHIDPSLQFRIVDPWKVLSVGEEVVLEGMEQITRDGFRQAATKRGADDLISDPNEVKQIVENDIDRRSDRWGILLLELPVTRVAPKSEKVIAAYEKLTIEARERPAEVLELGHVIKSTKRYMEELGIKDGEAALMAFDDSRGKARKRKRITISGDVDSTTRAAAVLGDAIESRSNDEGGV